MKVPVVKEWGSWVVFVSSVSAALVTGLLTGPQRTGRNLSLDLFLTIAGLIFLINSKNALASTLRTKGRQKEPLLWLLFFSLAGLAFLSPFLMEGIDDFSLFSLLILSYVFLLLRGKEHHIFTELNGFALLTLSAPVVYFAITGEMSLKLYLAVFIYFAAGVLKVRARLKKTFFFRLVMVLYCAAAAAFFYLIDVPVILLLPLAENIISVILMREEKLRVTGYIELSKGVVFVVLTGFFWR